MNQIENKKEFAVIYTFEVNTGMDKEFIKGWKGLTELIYQYEGSLGSRLHKLSDTFFVAYAKWPSKDLWEKAGKNLPDESLIYKEQMKSSCTKIETLFELNIVEDLIQNTNFKKHIL